MMTSKRGFRLGMCGAVLGAVYLSLAASAMAHNKEPVWVRQFGSEHDDNAYGVATDAAGNVYLTGYTRGAPGGVRRGHVDAWVAKYDAAGHLLWARQLGSELNDYAYGVATDSAGNVYLTGTTLGSLAGAGRGKADAWFAKYDAAGLLLWKRQFGTESYDLAQGVATDAEGNVYLTGYTGGSLYGANLGASDAWVAKYNAHGRKLWARQLGTDNYDRAFGVATDAAGNVYLTGNIFGSLVNAAWVAKYDAAGRKLWTRQLGSAGVGAQGIATDAVGNVYLAGSTTVSLGGPNRGSIDAWGAKYDSRGNVLWVRQLGTELDDQAFGVASDDAGNVYLTGVTAGSLGGGSSGGWDAWLAKYNAAGDVLWKRQLGAGDGARSVATDAMGSVYLTGDTNGSLGGVNRGKVDAWLAKYSTQP